MMKKTRQLLSRATGPAIITGSILLTVAIALACNNGNAEKNKTDEKSHDSNIIKIDSSVKSFKMLVRVKSGYIYELKIDSTEFIIVNDIDGIAITKK